MNSVADTLGLMMWLFIVVQVLTLVVQFFSNNHETKTTAFQLNIVCLLSVVMLFTAKAIVSVNLS